MLIALVYYGKYGPPRSPLPVQCIFPTELSCVGQAVADTTHVTFTVVNNVGRTITLLDTITGTDDCANPTLLTVNDAAAPQDVSKSAQATISIDCGSIEPGRFKTDLTLNYVNSYNGQNYSVTGEIRTHAE